MTNIAKEHGTLGSTVVMLQNEFLSTWLRDAAQATLPGGSLSSADRYLAKNNLVDASKSDEAVALEKEVQRD